MATDEYILERNSVETNRLNLQHYQTQQVFGYLLHPSIPTDKPDLRVADVGTGTAVWLIDMGAQLPSTAKLDGFDVSLSLAPASQWLPSNISLQHWDLLQDPPAELKGQYDVVHIRFFTFVIRSDDIDAVIRRCVELLKPGGYLQWVDVDMTTYHVEKADPGVKTSAHDQLSDFSLGSDPRIIAPWVKKLPDLFASSGGLCDVVEDTRRPTGVLMENIHYCALQVHEQIARSTGSSAQKVAELVRGVYEETKGGACYTVNRMTVVGRKPVK